MPTTADAPSVQECRDRLAIAQSRVQMSSQRYAEATAALEKLESVTDAHHKSSSVYVTAHDSARRAVIESAQDVNESRADLETAEAALTDALSDTYASMMPEWRSKKAGLAEQADLLLEQLSTVISELRGVFLEEFTHRRAAGISGIDAQRHDKLVGSAIVRALSGSCPPLRYVNWEAYPIRRGMVEVFRDPKHDDIEELRVEGDPL